MSHADQDRASEALADMIAAGLAAHPEWIELARANLRAWSRRHANVPSLLKCYAEWQGLLNQPTSAVGAVLTERSDRGQRLRQNSPFAGALSPAEVWTVKRRVRDGASAA